MIIKKVVLKNAYKTTSYIKKRLKNVFIFSGRALFYFPNKITGLNELSKKK